MAHQCTEEIKPGDLVIVVRPSICCGRSDSIGMTGIVQPNPSWATYAQCDQCGAVDYDTSSFRTIDGGGYHAQTLKKIDPLSEVDEIPTCRDMEVPA